MTNAQQAPTIEPVTVGGWYENTDGSVSEYRWQSVGQSQGHRLVRTVASWADVPGRDELEAADAAYQAQRKTLVEG